MSRPLLLLVEDAHDVALIAERYARRAGQDLVACGDAAAAWNWLTTRVPPARLPDLILLDVNLPGESGPELCVRIRGVPAWQALPVALFSHWDRPDDVALGIDAGAEYLVAKDLVCQPDAWRLRLEEILTPLDSRGAVCQLSWKVGPQGHSPEAFSALNQALRHPDLRFAGPEVVQALLRRILWRVESDFGLPSGTLKDWLASDGLSLRPVPAAGGREGEIFLAVATAWTEQISRLLGTTASAPCRAALARLVDTLMGLPR
jgi:CheY-like chemotaxis protein